MRAHSLRVLSGGAVLLALLSAGCGGGVVFPDGEGTWSTLQRAPFAGQARFAITDNFSDQISFVSADASQHAYLGALPVGNVPVALEGPHHLAGSPDGRFIYFNLSNYVPGTASGPHGAHGTGTVPGSLVKIDAGTGAKLGEVLVDRSPGDIILSKDGALAFVSHYDFARFQDVLNAKKPVTEAYSTVAIVDTSTMLRLSMIPVCVTAHGLGLSLDERSLYVSCGLTDELTIVDVSNPSAPSVRKRLPVGPLPGPVGQPSYWPYALTVSPRDGSVWISDNASNDVRVFDAARDEMDVARTVKLGGLAMFGSFDASGQTYYVPNQGDDRVSAVDTTTLAVRELQLPPESCLNAHVVTLNPDQQSAVLVCEGNHGSRPFTAGTVVFLSLPSFSVSGYVQTGLFPDGAAWLPPVP